MQLNEIRNAVKSGRTVHWSNSSYRVTCSTAADGSENWLIKHDNGHAIGLTWLDGVTLNGKESEFFTVEQEGANMAQVQKLELSGRRWFDRRNGNTYFSASAVLNGEEIASVACDYGYGDHWLDRICDEVDRAEVITVKRETYANGLKEVPWQWLQRIEAEAGIAVFTNCVDVQRKKDL